MNVLNVSFAAVVGASAAVSFGGFSLHKQADHVGATAPQMSKVQVVSAQPKPAEPVAKAPVIVTIQPGDYLQKIAAENNTTPERLFAANTEIERPDLIFPNQQVRIPEESEVLPERAMPEPIAVAAPTEAVKPTRAARVSSAPAVSDGSEWDRLAACEAGGNWATNTGNGYYGGLQFSASSWRGVGGSGLPSDASREEQIMRGQMLQARQGWGAWPSCSARLGLS